MNLSPETSQQAFNRLFETRLRMMNDSKRTDVVKFTEIKDRKVSFDLGETMIRFCPGNLETAKKVEVHSLTFDITIVKIDNPYIRYNEGDCILLYAVFDKIPYIKIIGVPKVDMIVVNIVKKSGAEPEFKFTIKDRKPYELMDFLKGVSNEYDMGYTKAAKRPLPPLVTHLDGRSAQRNDARITFHHEKGIVPVNNLWAD